MKNFVLATSLLVSISLTACFQNDLAEEIVPHGGTTHQAIHDVDPTSSPIDASQERPTIGMKEAAGAYDDPQYHRDAAAKMIAGVMVELENGEFAYVEKVALPEETNWFKESQTGESIPNAAAIRDLLSSTELTEYNGQAVVGNYTVVGKSDCPEEIYQTMIQLAKPSESAEEQETRIQKAAVVYSFTQFEEAFPNPELWESCSDAFVIRNPNPESL